MNDIIKKYGWLISNLNPQDETFEEMFPSLIEGLHHDKQVCIERGHPLDINSYLGFKQELETLLTERNIDDIEEVMLKSENPRYIDRNKNAQFLERIYHEIYKDDLEYKAELVQTPIEELLKMHF